MDDDPAFESWQSQLSNAATLVARGVHHLEIHAVLESALDLDGLWQNRHRLDILCDTISIGTMARTIL